MPSPSQPDSAPAPSQLDAAVSREALPAGSRVGGCQIVDVLGGGGFGIVYLALDLSLQRQVAIKEYVPTDLAARAPDLKLAMRPRADGHAYAAGLRAFLDEAQQLARFDHPSLVRVYSFWEENNTAYMVMPFYAGQTLAGALHAMKQPPEEAWLRALLSPLLDVLGTLHAAGTWHRDISPQNILLQPDGRPVLLDFGTASRAARDKTIPLTALLNPAFAPIEQYSESPQLRQGPWTDLYALASVVYLAIVGKPPMSATVRAVDDQQPPLSEVIRPLQLAVPGLRYTAGFLAAIDKALAIHPKDRPQDVAEFRAALDRPLAAVPPRADAVEDEDDEVSAAIATALRSVPGQARAEPVFRMPEVKEGAVQGGAPKATASVRRNAHWRRRLLPWLMLLGAGTVVAAGTWQWSRSQQSGRTMDAMSGGVREFLAAGSAAAATPAPAASQATAPATMEASGSAVPPSASTVVQAPLPSSAPAPTAREEASFPLPAPMEAKPVEGTKPGADRQPAAKAPENLAGKAPQKTPEKVAPTEPGNPRAMCAPRTNFALLYCMQSQCLRPQYAQHAQCVDLKRRGDLN